MAAVDALSSALAGGEGPPKPASTFLPCRDEFAYEMGQSLCFEPALLGYKHMSLLAAQHAYMNSGLCTHVDT